MQLIEIIHENVPFKIRKHFEQEDKNVLGEVFSEQSYPLSRFIELAPDIIFDIGGHIGSFSKRCHHVFPGCHTFTLEPDEENYRMCKENLDELNNTNIIRGVFNYYPDKKYFYRSVKQASGGGFLTNELIANKDGVNQQEEQVYALHENFDIPHYTLRSLMDEAGVDKVDLLKLDCEGGENGFLKPDCRDLELLKDIDIIMGEWHGHEAVNETGDSQSKFCNTMRELLRETHTSWFHDPISGDGLGIFGFLKR